MVDKRGVSEGYKRTEVGMIPKEWRVEQLGGIFCNVRLGGNYKNSEEETKFPLIKMGNIGRGDINLSKIEYIAEGIVPSHVDRLEYGDLLFNTRNTLELVGKAAIWKGELPEAYYNSNLLNLRFNKKYVVSTFFMNYMLNAQSSIRQLREVAIGTTSVAAIYTRDLCRLIMPLPSLCEQQAIAEALSDMDNLIESVERLIDKKRKIKGGAMQELLTGKRRLPGFLGEWAAKRIGDIAQICMGQSPHSKYYNTEKMGLPLIQGNADIAEKKTIVRVFTSDVTRIAKCGDIIMTVRAPVGYVAKTFFKCCLGRGVCSISYENDYLYHYLVYIEDSWKEVSTGSTFDSISKNSLKSVEVKIPESREEQQAIAQVLSDMDSGIEALVEKLNKYRAIKQGMMQELLTGRIRLI